MASPWTNVRPGRRRHGGLPADRYIAVPVTDAPRGQEAKVSPFSVVVTVFNDRVELAQLLDALEHQSCPPAEVVIVDGGSTDGTQELVRDWQPKSLEVRLLVEPGSNISAGRNVGIAAAKQQWVACTDAGCRPVREWLEAFEGALEDGDLLAGIYVVVGETPFEQALAAALYPSPDEIADQGTFVKTWLRVFGKRYEATHAATRSIAFTRHAWEAAGGFPEHVYAGEDPAFSQAVLRAGLRAELVPRASVKWRPRPTWRANARMYRTYARGSIATGAYSRHAIRALVWSALPGLGLCGGLPGRAVVVAFAAAYLSLPVRRARRSGIPATSWWRLPGVIAMKDLSQIAGAALGISDRLRGVAQPTPWGGQAQPLRQEA